MELTDFEWALQKLREGEKVTRRGWNDKDMFLFLFLVPGSTFKENRSPLFGIYQESTEIKYYPHIDMKITNNTVMPWLVSQTDMLAEDWQVV